MTTVRFLTDTGVEIPPVTEAQMRLVDQFAVEDFGLGILQMMENAGRSLAGAAMSMVESSTSTSITVLAGAGGNGGGGLAAARHLFNRGFPIQVLLSKPVDEYRQAAAIQLHILMNAGLTPSPMSKAADVISNSDLIMDALIGYSLKGPPAGTVLKHIQATNQSSGRVLALDIPSGVNATTGETPGEFIKADRTLTLALPKPGLSHPDAGDVYLADIGIPAKVYRQIGIQFDPFFGSEFMLELSIQS